MDALIGLDALVANTLAGNPVALGSYESVRVINRTRRAATKAPPAEAPAAPAAVPAPEPVPVPAAPIETAA